MRPLHHADLATAVPVDGRGRRSIETMRRLHERDALICEAAAAHFAGASMNEAAHRLHAAMQIYECGAWRRERIADVCPPRHAGRIAAHCWQILRQVDRTPSARSIRAILSRATFRCQAAALQCDSLDSQR